MNLGSGFFNKTKQVLQASEKVDGRSDGMDEAEVTSMSRSTDTAAGKITAFFGDVFSFRDNKKLEKAMTTGAEKTEACKTKTEIGRPGKTGQWNGAVSDWSKFEGVFFQGRPQS